MKKLNTLPISLNLSGKRILFIGGGEVARRKIEQYSGRGATLMVVAPLLCTTLELLLSELSDLTVIKRYYEVSDLESVDLVHICTNNSQVNDDIEAACKARHLWFCRSDQSHSDFTGMSLIESGQIQIAIGTSGVAPVAVRAIKEQINESLDFDAIEKRIEVLGILKNRFKVEMDDQKRRADLLRTASQMSLDELEGLLENEALYSRFKG